MTSQQREQILNALNALKYDAANVCVANSCRNTAILNLEFALGLKSPSTYMVFRDGPPSGKDRKCVEVSTHTIQNSKLELTCTQCGHIHKQEN